MRGGLDQFRRLLDFTGYGAHGCNEQVEFLDGLALGGLDHERAVDDHGKTYRVGVETVVDKTLGNVAGFDAEGRLALVAEDYFVHGRRFVGQLVNVFELFADVVGVEDGVFGGLSQPVRPVGQDVGQRADEHAGVAV